MKGNRRMQKSTVFQKRNCLIVFIGLLGCMVVGSFYDYQISSTLYNPLSKFGTFLASYGQLPAMLCFSIGGSLLIHYVKDERKTPKRIGGYIGGVVLNVFAIFGVSMDPILYIEGMNIIVSVVIAIIIVLAVDFMMLKLVQDNDRKMIKKVIIVLIATMFIEIVLINIIKIPWGRPRMRMIMVEEQAVFQPWWVIGSGMKTQLMALGVAAEEFESFPSGHTGNATCAILISILPLISAKFKGKENLLFFTGIAFAFIVAFSRVIMGAHFLTDVTVGMSVTFMISVILVRKIFAHELK